MNCKKCGKEVNEAWSVCPFCGTEIEKDILCAKCGQKLDESWVACPFCGCEAEAKPAEQAPEEKADETPVEEATAVEAPAEEAAETQAHVEEVAPERAVATAGKPMKWYKFLMFGGLWVLLAYKIIALLTNIVSMVNTYIHFIRYDYPTSYVVQIAWRNCLSWGLAVVGIALVAVAAIMLIKKKRAAGLCVFAAFIWPVVSLVIYWAVVYFVSAVGSLIDGMSIFEIAKAIFREIFINRSYSISGILTIAFGARFAMPLVVVLGYNVILHTPIALLNLVYFAKRKDVFVN